MSHLKGVISDSVSGVPVVATVRIEPVRGRLLVEHVIEYKPKM